MSRVTLPPTLPPHTAAFNRFEQTNVELNRFYWTFKCSLEHILPYMAVVGSVPELLKGPSGERLNISSNQFIAEAPQTERVARHSLLVLAVTAYEDYLKEILTTFLIKNWKSDKTYKVSFRPQDLPATADMQDWLREKSMQTVVDDHISRAYDGRFAAISKLVVEYGAQRPNLHKSMQELSGKACEARNCIVHSSAIVDARAAKALVSVVPGIAEGASLDISEDLLWKFFGALRDSARALDVELRKLT
ncbi:hypothetical protein [Azonexus sp.]|uniref:hypothetical protein n=1 Tax=Azonexus sp. TaxID=1872668 RepID=UPI0035B2BB00